jgi:hypothetical protein
MSTLPIQVSGEVERGLQHEAARCGRSVEEIAGAALEARFEPPETAAGMPEEVPSLFDGLPRRTPADLLALAEEQGVKPVERFEDLLGDFWPEDETCDEFLAWLRMGRQDSGGEAPPW